MEEASDSEPSSGGHGGAGEGMRIVDVNDVADVSTTSNVDNSQPEDKGGSDDGLSGLGAVVPHSKMTSGIGGMIRGNTPPKGRQRGYSSQVWKDIRRLTPEGLAFLGVGTASDFTHVCVREMPPPESEDTSGHPIHTIATLLYVFPGRPNIHRRGVSVLGTGICRTSIRTASGRRKARHFRARSASKYLDMN